MELNIKGINDLYFERYIETKKMIDQFHEMVQSGELEGDIDRADKIGIAILNQLVEDTKDKTSL